MLAFEIYVNDRKVVTAGLDSFGVVSAHVNWARWDPKKLPKRRVLEVTRLHVGGLRSSRGEYLTWMDRPLKSGDSVRIEIVEADKVSRVRSTRRRESSEARLRREQEHVLAKAREWGWKVQSDKRAGRPEPGRNPKVTRTRRA
jgi:hypothetical protein